MNRPGQSPRRTAALPNGQSGRSRSVSLTPHGSGRERTSSKDTSIRSPGTRSRSHSLGHTLPSWEGTGTTLEAMCMSDAGVRSLDSRVRQLRGWRGR